MSLIEVCIVTLIIICVTRMYCDGAWVVIPKYKHLRHCSILQYILIVRHFVVGLDLGAMKCMA